jgi:Kef-type K+ transport system membrane component KefB
MTLIQNLCLLLIVAHLLGWLAARCGQPELVGYLLAGVLLGPAVLNWVSADNLLNAFVDLAVLFVAISAGLKVRLRDIAPMFTGRGCAAMTPSIVLPSIAGFGLALGFAFSIENAAVVGLCMAVTALPVALSILSSFGLIGTRLAHMAIASALLADVLVLLSLGILNGAHAGQYSLLELAGFSLLKLLALALLLALSAALCKRLYQQRAVQPQRLAAAQLSLSLLLILALAAATDALGLHFAVGAFLGALTVAEYHSDTSARHPLRAQLEGVSNMIFAPLFLAAQGTHFTISTLHHPAFVLCLVLVAVLTKLAGGYWGARWLGLSVHEARGTAIVMNARGLMEMVIASIAYRSGLVDQALFSTLLVMGICTTLLTPLLLKQWQQQQVSISGASNPAD